MTGSIESLTRRPAWKALAAHHQEIGDLHLRKLFADDPEARRADDGRGPGHLPRLLEESHHRRDPQAAPATGRGMPICERGSTPCSGVKRSTSRRTALSCTWPCARQRGLDRRRWRKRGASGPRRPRQDGGFLRPGAQRHLERLHRETHSQRREHRYRRLRPRARDGLRGTQAVQRPGLELSVCFQRRRHRSAWKRPATSIRRKRCSSSRPRPSPPWRR